MLCEQGLTPSGRVSWRGSAGAPGRALLLALEPARIEAARDAQQARSLGSLPMADLMDLSERLAARLVRPRGRPLPPGGVAGLVAGHRAGAVRRRGRGRERRPLGELREDASTTPWRTPSLSCRRSVSAGAGSRQRAGEDRADAMMVMAPVRCAV
jgi:hypothetical protein